MTEDNALRFVCPVCRAAVGAKCTEKNPIFHLGMQFIERVHAERLAKGNESVAGRITHEHTAHA